MQIDPLRELIAAHAQQCDSCIVHAQSLLLDGASIGAADAKSRLRQIERARLFRDGSAEQIRTRGERLARRERVLDFADCAQRDPRIVSHRFFLLERANLHLGCERAALIDRREQSSAQPAGRILVILLQVQDLALERAEVEAQRDLRQARRLGFPDAVEGRRDAPLGGDHVRPALEHLQRHADGYGVRHREELRHAR